MWRPWRFLEVNLEKFSELNSKFQPKADLSGHTPFLDFDAEGFKLPRSVEKLEGGQRPKEL
jgi:hypothetical protein